MRASAGHPDDADSRTAPPAVAPPARERRQRVRRAAHQVSCSSTSRAPRIRRPYSSLPEPPPPPPSSCFLPATLLPPPLPASSSLSSSSPGAARIVAAAESRRCSDSAGAVPPCGGGRSAQSSHAARAPLRSSLMQSRAAAESATASRTRSHAPKSFEEADTQPRRAHAARSRSSARLCGVGAEEDGEERSSRAAHSMGNATFTAWRAARACAPVGFTAATTAACRTLLALVVMDDEADTDAAAAAAVSPSRASSTSGHSSAKGGASMSQRSTNASRAASMHVLWSGCSRSAPPRQSSAPRLRADSAIGGRPPPSPPPPPPPPPPPSLPPLLPPVVTSEPLAAAAARSAARRPASAAEPAACTSGASGTCVIASTTASMPPADSTAAAPLAPPRRPKRPRHRHASSSRGAYVACRRTAVHRSAERGAAPIAWTRADVPLLPEASLLVLWRSPVRMASRSKLVDSGGAHRSIECSAKHRRWEAVGLPIASGRLNTSRIHCTIPDRMSAKASVGARSAAT